MPAMHFDPKGIRGHVIGFSRQFKALHKEVCAILRAAAIRGHVQISSHKLLDVDKPNFNTFLYVSPADAELQQHDDPRKLDQVARTWPEFFRFVRRIIKSQ